MASFELLVSVSTLGWTKVDWRKKGKIAKGAYCALWATPRIGSFYMGAGYVTDASFLYASAAVEALQSLLDDGTVDPDDEAFQLEIYGNCGGVDAKAASSVRQWVAGRGRGADGREIQNFETWRQLDQLFGLGRVRFRQADYERQQLIRVLLGSSSQAKQLPEISPETQLAMRHWRS